MQGRYSFKLLSVDVPSAVGGEQRIFLAGDEEIYGRGGVMGQLRDPFTRVGGLGWIGSRVGWGHQHIASPCAAGCICCCIGLAGWSCWLGWPAFDGVASSSKCPGVCSYLSTQYEHTHPPNVQAIRQKSNAAAHAGPAAGQGAELYLLLCCTPSLALPQAMSLQDVYELEDAEDDKEDREGAQSSTPLAEIL